MKAKIEGTTASSFNVPGQVTSQTQTLQNAQWDDLQMSPLGLTGTGLTAPVAQVIMTSQGATGGTNGVWGMGFLNTREDDQIFMVQFPHSYKEGSEIRFHVHWTMVTTATGNVTWGLEYAWSNFGGSFRKTVAANAANTRQRTGTTARLTFTVPHYLVVGQNIVVAGAGVVAYNGNYKVTAKSDTVGAYWIEYTIASGEEAPTVDAAVNVQGYTIQIEGTETLSTDSQYKHLLTPVGTIEGSPGGTNKAISHVLICRFYRPATGIAARIPVLSYDFHYQKDTHGSVNETSKT